jgi:hypothetical protein
MGPAPDFRGHFLGFQVEIDDLRHALPECGEGARKATALCGRAGLACEFLSHKV